MRPVVTVVGIACIVGTLQCEGARLGKKRTHNNVSIEEDYSTSSEEDPIPIDNVRIIPSLDKVNKELNTETKPHQLLAHGFKAIGPIFSKLNRGEKITSTDLFDAGASFIPAALGMANPLLGVFASMIFGLFAKPDTALADMEKRILEQVGLLIRKNRYQVELADVVERLYSVGHNIQDCCWSYQGKAASMAIYAKDMVDYISDALGGCNTGQDPYACTTWREGTESLEYSITYAQLHMQILGEVARLSEEAVDRKTAAGLMKKYGKMYADLITVHYNVLYNHRTDPDLFTRQTYLRENCYPTCTYTIVDDAMDNYLEMPYSDGDGCHPKGYTMRSGRKYTKKFLAALNKKFDDCKSLAITRVQTQLEDFMKPAVQALCDTFGQGKCNVTR